jgi:hypothetical protein
MARSRGLGDVYKRQPELTDENGVFHPADIGPGLQFKELMAIGFTYTFNTK